ncbi:hypothetical protein [Dysgonomonas macrotermitis]|uniref:Uncharacterized protein n=1 Tax=Dysgonomonas macrotermitis TaxID=1346286 RepID=A0A1M4UNN6_9BACT|nr:hypothetical protein [Dysgonomonas macrotermitis]SHE58304.1 hypothetical protein SAMN05444362_101655 [Dysgonomonas macrotermitis]
MKYLSTVWILVKVLFVIGLTLLMELLILISKVIGLLIAIFFSPFTLISIRVMKEYAIHLMEAFKE